MIAKSREFWISQGNQAARRASSTLVFCASLIGGGSAYPELTWIYMKKALKIERITF
jgi:hypothetical protein